MTIIQLNALCLKKKKQPNINNMRSSAFEITTKRDFKMRYMMDLNAEHSKISGLAVEYYSNAAKLTQQSWDHIPDHF